MTEELYVEDSYKKQIASRVVEVHSEGIVVDRTIFYPVGGGQPGDSGLIRSGDGLHWRVSDTRKDRLSGKILHIVDPANTCQAGDEVELSLDWERRYANMRMHTCLHLLCSLIKAPVTGGSINGTKGRLDFALGEAPDKQSLEDDLNKLVEANASVSDQWLSDGQLEARPELIRTMSVSPPKGTGSVRLVSIASVDLQPCGGTHVRQTSEIGPVKVVKIENKGRQNRRINLELVPACQQ